MLYGILVYSKSLPYKSTLRFVEKFKGEKLRAPQKTKKWSFFRGEIHNLGFLRKNLKVNKAYLGELFGQK